jgi:hypothetical protein
MIKKFISLNFQEHSRVIANFNYTLLYINNCLNIMHKALKFAYITFN